MGLSTQNRQNYTWLNVKEGKLKGNDGEEYDTMSGVITGIRTRENDFRGDISTQIQIRMIDPDDPKCPPVVLTATLINKDEEVTVFARVLIPRLVEVMEEFDIKTPIDISVFMPKQQKPGFKITLCSVKIASTGFVVKGPEITKDDPVTCRLEIEDMVDRLKAAWGGWGKGETEQKAEYTEQGESIGQPAIVQDDADLPF